MRGEGLGTRGFGQGALDEGPEMRDEGQTIENIYY